MFIALRITSERRRIRRIRWPPSAGEAMIFFYLSYPVHPWCGGNLRSAIAVNWTCMLKNLPCENFMYGEFHLVTQCCEKVGPWLVLSAQL